MKSPGGVVLQENSFIPRHERNIGMEIMFDDFGTGKFWL